jgi:FixJ family two-component response regulator
MSQSKAQQASGQERDSRATVYIIDDDEPLRTSLASLFNSVGLNTHLFRSAIEFLDAKLPRRSASCLVLDVRLPGMSGLDFQAELEKAGPHIPIVFITGHGDIPMTVKAMKAGAVEFLTKPFRDQDLLDAVQAALERSRTQDMQERQISCIRQSFCSLTTREQEVLKLVAAGLMNKQIAAELGVSEITVKIHRGNMMRKMRAKSLAELVRMADSLGLVSVQPSAAKLDA